MFEVGTPGPRPLWFWITGMALSKPWPERSRRVYGMQAKLLAMCRSTSRGSPTPDQELARARAASGAHGPLSARVPKGELPLRVREREHALPPPVNQLNC